MSDFPINPFSDSVVVKYKCPSCGYINVSDSLDVPSPDWEAETSHDSTEFESYDENCIECGEMIQIDVFNAFYGGTVSSNDAEILDVEEFSSEYEDYDYELFENSNPQIIDKNLKECSYVLDSLGDIQNNRVKDFLIKSVYTGLIATLESYLHSLLISWVFKSEQNKIKFISCYKPFSKKTVTFDKLPEIIKNIDKYIKQELHGHVYHNIGKVKPMFEEIMGVTFNDISVLCKCIEIRHHIVHRNGHDLEGNPIIITEEDVRNLASEVEKFIIDINSQLNKDS